MSIIFKRINGEVQYWSEEKVFAMRHHKTRKNGEKYVYSNYIVFFNQDLLDLVGAKNYLYLYKLDGEVYLTGVEPASSIEYKKMKLNIQRGTKEQREKEDNPGKYWKRFFVLPKKLFNVTEEDTITFMVDLQSFDPCTGTSPLIKMEVNSSVEEKV